MAISAILVAAIYSSSTLIVFADIKPVKFCSPKAKDGSYLCCFSFANPKDDVCYECKLQSDGSYKCSQLIVVSPPPDVMDAIKKVQSSVGGGATTGENNTSVTSGKTLKPGGALTGENTGGNNNTNALTGKTVKPDGSLYGNDTLQ